MKKKEVCNLLDELWLSVYSLAEDMKEAVREDHCIRNEDFKDGVQLGIRVVILMVKMEINRQREGVRM